MFLRARFLRTATANAAQLDAVGVARAMHEWMDELFFRRLPRHALWANADEDECEGTKEAVEKFIVSKLPAKYVLYFDFSFLIFPVPMFRNVEISHKASVCPFLSLAPSQRASL